MYDCCEYDHNANRGCYERKHMVNYDCYENQYTANYDCEERERTLNLVRAYSFAAYDASLYLDAYPTCKRALAYYHKYRKLHEEARKAFECRFGPLTHDGETNLDKWTWVEGLWPWEMEG